MKIRLAHLYGNLLNTYGDVGNIMALRYHLRKKGYEVETDLISLGDKFDNKKYDFVFFGGGQDYEQSIVEKDLFKKRDYLKEYIESDGLFLSICGGFQLLGDYYSTMDGKKIDGLKIFKHYTINPKGSKRFISNVKIESTDSKEIYYGFENHGGRTYLSKDQVPFGKVIEGNGNNGEDKTEGFVYKNTYGTYLHGPLLARNEKLCDNFVKIIEKKLIK